MLTQEQIEKALSDWNPSNDFAMGFKVCATWANEQNAAEIADMKFRIEGDAILLQAANQTIEKERAKISELEKYRDNHLRTIAALQDEKAEMLAFLQNVGSPKRKSEEEGWDIFEIARRARALVKKYKRGIDMPKKPTNLVRMEGIPFDEAMENKKTSDGK